MRGCRKRRRRREEEKEGITDVALGIMRDGQMLIESVPGTELFATGSAGSTPIRCEKVAYFASGKQRKAAESSGRSQSVTKPKGKTSAPAMDDQRREP